VNTCVGSRMLAQAEVGDRRMMVLM
jgi:hypothetical protein